MQHLESLFDRALDAVVGMNSSGDVVAWNAAAEDIFGWRRDEALGANMGDLIVPSHLRAAHTRGLNRYNRTGEGPVLEQRLRLTAMHRDGSEFPVEISIFPMEGADAPSMFYAFIRSLKAEMETQRQQELRVREAEVLLKISHQLLEEQPLEKFTSFCLSEACEISGMDAAHYFVVRGNGEARVLTPSGVWHLRDETYCPVVTETSRIQFKLGEGLPGRAWQTGKVEALSDLVNDCKFVRRAVFAQVGLAKGVAIPIQHGGRIQAVLEFFGTSAARLDAEVLRLLKTVGSQIGAAIRQKEEAERRELLRREMTHRVGNSLMVVASIYRTCSRAASNLKELDEAFLGRVTAIGRANNMAIVEADRGVLLSDLISNSLAILPTLDHVTVSVPSLFIGPDEVMPLSLVLNELATNALKYGALGSESRLYIRTSQRQGKGLELFWEELRFEPLSFPPTQPSREGFGSRLMQAMIEGRLGGSYRREFDQAGYHFAICLPHIALNEGPNGAVYTELDASKSPGR